MQIKKTLSSHKTIDLQLPSMAKKKLRCPSIREGIFFHIDANMRLLADIRSRLRFKLLGGDFRLTPTYPPRVGDTHNFPPIDL